MPRGPGTRGPPNHINYYGLRTGGQDYLGICTLSACREEGLVGSLGKLASALTACGLRPRTPEGHKGALVFCVPLRGVSTANRQEYPRVPN